MAGGWRFGYLMQRLAERMMPFRKPRILPGPKDNKPLGPELETGRGRRRRRERKTTLRDYLEIIFWTLVVYGLWMLWNYGVWGWF